MEARIHIETPSPPCCSACYQAVPEKRHVDFGASTDGPVTNVIAPDAIGVVGHVVDEIIICETCIADAARLIGLEDVGTLREELDAALESNDALHDQLTSQRAGIEEALEGVKAVVTGATPPPNGNSLIPQSPMPKPARRARKKKATA